MDGITTWRQSLCIPNVAWLLTSVLNPTSAAEDRYNNAHIQSRNKIERAFGVLKPRLRCVDSSGEALLYTPIFGVKLQ